MYRNLLLSLFVLLIYFASASALHGGAIIKKFECKDGGNKVVLRWTSTIELSLARYEIERSLDNKIFNRIAKIDAKGPSNYEYIDNSVFKQISHTFYYRLRIVDENGNSTLYGETLSIKPSVSGVKHTWGSLKAMFR
ncbi:hypothetical protein JXJ21_22910 [candidate division KSB1 bacterium]|nr:hypothetical protein [candidate division KSB1 bacterium]